MATWEPQSTLAKAVKEAGFLYEPAQDIIYSRITAPQYGLGYCWAYDCSSAPLSMIIDCERFYFTHRGQHWMIELWKGQYELETGCEIGVYCDYSGPAARAVGLNPGSRFYSCARPHDWLRMTSTLYRNGKKLFHRVPQFHWWLTGFKWGVFTRHTRELTMDVGIDFPNKEMCGAFTVAAKGIGYQLRKTGASSIALTFGIPHTLQPPSRSHLEGRKQVNNQHLVKGYNLLKDALHISNNDPNKFTLDRAADAVRPLVSRAATHLPHAVSGAARSLQRETVAKARKQKHEVPDEALTAYHKILGFFQNRVWRTTHRPGTAA